MVLRRLKSRLAWVVLIMAGLVAGVLWYLSTPGSGPVTVRRERLFPFQMEFGRGSGWHGLDTVKISQRGTVTLDRSRYPHWETTTLQLPDESMEQVLKSVKKNRLRELSREYHGNIADGTQWVLWFKQNDVEKSVYFDNRFPDDIVRFAKDLDGILAKNGLQNAQWQRVNVDDARKHERKLWDSIKR